MKIGYSETFPVIGKDRWQKNWLEDEVNLNIDYLNLSDADIEKVILNVRRIQYALQKQVQSFHYESVKAAEKQLTEQKEEPKTQQEKIIDQINGCSDLKVLQSFELISRKYTTVKNAYNTKYEHLHQIEIQKLQK